VTGNNNLTGVEVQTSIAFLFQGIAEENASRRACGKFVWGGGVEVWKAEASENTEVVIGRMLAKKAKIGSLL
jgi:hypothetical protein